ncbi:hypothetical protein COY26_00705 [Candidatus Woesearchaeota archaeon CG_4_10_14_0_2_um_filter_33_10]|nr:MAG: hypothetical protein COY26_00705 [Candidatus Woesearchaeota archaeon CG_4_10_14_0_2_um_filter_33_10]
MANPIPSTLKYHLPETYIFTAPANLKSYSGKTYTFETHLLSHPWSGTPDEIINKIKTKIEKEILKKGNRPLNIRIIRETFTFLPLLFHDKYLIKWRCYPYTQAAKDERAKISNITWAPSIDAIVKWFTP